MSDELEDYLHDLQQEIALAASEEGNERACPRRSRTTCIDVLTEAGEIDDAQVASYQSTGAGPRRSASARTRAHSGSSSPITAVI